ncbi:MAG: LysR substrate-binding domain-containing protein [Xanthomonadales bacterium]|nr:LysR substrate-binding domain-containing protein [Xanthomonadales bacterium]
MRKRLPSLNLLRAFERAAYHRSFKLAAEDLHITPSAVSHKIKQLEEELEIPLFHRVTRAVKLTPAGQAYFKDVHRAFARLETGTRQLHDRYGKQVLRLHLLPFFASEVLVPKLHSFQMRHPDIDLHLESSFGSSETHPEDADISIALGKGRWPGLEAVELMQLELMAFCTPELAKQIRPDHPEDINDHAVIYFATKLDAWEQWTRGMGLKKFSPRQTLTVDSMFSALQAAEQGLGVVLAALPLTQERLSRSTLVPPFEKRVAIADRYYLVYRKADQVRPNVQKFREWIVDAFAKIAGEAVPHSDR